MKFKNIVVVLIILQACIMLYDGMFYDAPEYCVGETCYQNYTQSAYDSNQSVIWDFALNPTKWNGSTLIDRLLLLGVAVSVYIVVGSFARTPTDTSFFSPLFLITIAAGFVPIISLRHVIVRDVGIFGCTIGEFCLGANLAWVFIGGIFGILFVLSAIEFWRSGLAG